MTVDNSVTGTDDLSLSDASDKEARTLYIPLQFWFCRNPGLALPLIALQYHEVKINVEFASSSSVFSGIETTPSFDAELYVDYYIPFVIIPSTLQSIIYSNSIGTL